ncbi:MAG: antitoxin VapB family protein [Prosthecobacter sp.]|uniref:antitoxin VapB family protein n=1 Tax=Prosthecobacter sp. TaxID=1965333 RepID=UPI00390122A3
MRGKTITLELDAYTKLRKAKHSGETFSSVVRRAVFAGETPTGAELMSYFRKGGSRVSASYLDEVEAAARKDSPPDDPWD